MLVPFSAVLQLNRRQTDRRAYSGFGTPMVKKSLKYQSTACRRMTMSRTTSSRGLVTETMMPAVAIRRRLSALLLASRDRTRPEIHSIAPARNRTPRKTPAVSSVEGIFPTGTSSNVINGTHSEQTSPAIAIRSLLMATESVPDGSSIMSRLGVLLLLNPSLLQWSCPVLEGTPRSLLDSGQFTLNVSGGERTPK